jgi:hypothetical protein
MTDRDFSCAAFFRALKTSGAQESPPKAFSPSVFALLRSILLGHRYLPSDEAGSKSFLTLEASSSQLAR